MLVRLSVMLAALAVLFATVPAWAVCDPFNTKQTSCLGGPDKTCSTLGATSMDKDRKNLIACLENNLGTQEWKSMSGGGIPEYRTGDFCGATVIATPLMGTPTKTTIAKCQGIEPINGCPTGFKAFTFDGSVHPNALTYHSCMKL